MRLARGTAHWVAAPLVVAGLLLVFAMRPSASGSVEQVVGGVLLLIALVLLVAARVKGWPFETALALPFVLGGAALTLLGPGGIGAVGVLVLLFALFLANFFRDPERALGEGLVSPADGLVTEVREAEDGGHVVVIFMNVHDVHVNRAPCDGRVVRRHYQPGSHMPAWKKDSERNERMTWDLATPQGDVRVVQIAGLLARRIVPYVAEGAQVRKGERLGIIRLGSRVDVHLPPGLAPAVRVGEKVRAGSSSLAADAKR